jgi:hypothetical protein
VQIPLMAARFGGVIAAISSQASEPGKDFVFQLELSPALLSAKLVASGDIDAWIWRLWRGWPGVDGQPLLAAVLLVSWAVVAGVCVTALWRSVRTSDTS